MFNILVLRIQWRCRKLFVIFWSSVQY